MRVLYRPCERSMQDLGEGMSRDTTQRNVVRQLLFRLQNRVCSRRAMNEQLSAEWLTFRTRPVRRWTSTACRGSGRSWWTRPEPSSSLPQSTPPVCQRPQGYGCVSRLTWPLWWDAAGTFTISNLGMFGVDRFDAILPPGTVRARAGWAAAALVY